MIWQGNARPRIEEATIFTFTHVSPLPPDSKTIQALSLRGFTCCWPGLSFLFWSFCEFLSQTCTHCQICKICTSKCHGCCIGPASEIRRSGYLKFGTWGASAILLLGLIGLSESGLLLRPLHNLHSIDHIVCNGLTPNGKFASSKCALGTGKQCSVKETGAALASLYSPSNLPVTVTVHPSH